VAQAPDTTLDFIATFSPPGNAERFFRTVAGLGHDYGHYGKVGLLRCMTFMHSSRALHDSRCIASSCLLFVMVPVSWGLLFDRQPSLRQLYVPGADPTVADDI
jgi:hypothetical protein